MKFTPLKFTPLKVLSLAFSLSALATINAAQASTLNLSADLNPDSSGEQYQFANNFVGGTGFSDVINLDITPNRNLVASASGTSSSQINFTAFDLYSGVFGSTSTLIALGDVISPYPNLTLGFLTADDLSGNYYILVEGSHLGASSYNGNISLTDAEIVNPPSEVPVPAALPLMAAGLGLFGLMSRRKNI